MRTINLLGLCGSLRRDSTNAIILRTLAMELMPACVHLSTHSLQNLPFYNEDHDVDNLPRAVLDFHLAVVNVDGVVLATPEYCHSLSGVMKNALDWLSSPHRSSPLINKPVITITGSSALIGGARAQQQLNEILWSMKATLVPYPQIVITDANAKISNARLTEEATRQFLAEGMLAMEEMIRTDTLPTSSLIWA